MGTRSAATRATAVVIGLMCCMPSANATEVDVMRAAVTIDAADVSGSAFCIAPHTLVTAAHVVEGHTSMSATTWNSEQHFQVSVVRADAALDLALLTTSATCPKTLKLSSETLTAGSVVFAVGSPIGSPVLSEGTFKQVVDGKLQATIAVAPGSSGGPLLGTNDEVVGVVVEKDTFGHAYAVPTSTLQGFMDATPKPTASSTPAASATGSNSADTTAATALAFLALLTSFAAAGIATAALVVAKRRRRPIVITLDNNEEN